jgi:hypothetical protein
MKTIETISTLFFLSTLTFGCATAQLSGPGNVAAAERGDVLVAGPSVKAVVVGPTAIHAYSAFSGGSMYTAPIVSGTDADCQAHAADGARSDLQADSVVTFTVGAGQVACLATTSKKSFELLWHTHQNAAAPTQLAIAQNR